MGSEQSSLHGQEQQEGHGHNGGKPAAKKPAAKKPAAKKPAAKKK